ncbi:YgaP family membrane protein [Nitrospina sp. 32_T5]|uniref:YgaP family membrane protein n=1 Tax=unclassified Nitrospina TaxID=2638683 RepID=UPI003F9BBAF2
MMNANAGRMDRWVRVVVGIALLAAAWMSGGPWGITLGVIAFIPILTGILGWCPLYAIFNFNTCPFDRTRMSSPPKA